MVTLSHWKVLHHFFVSFLNTNLFEAVHFKFGSQEKQVLLNCYVVAVVGGWNPNTFELILSDQQVYSWRIEKSVRSGLEVRARLFSLHKCNKATKAKGTLKFSAIWNKKGVENLYSGNGDLNSRRVRYLHQMSVFWWKLDNNLHWESK